MNALAGRAAQAVTSIRVRLAVALFVALLPVLLLGVLQSIFAFRAEADARRQSLELAAGHSATIARARIEAAGVLLQTLGPGSVGLECAQRLADVRARLTGYANLIRFDARGRVACAAATTPYDIQRGARPWFQSLRNGDPIVVASVPGAAYANEPAVLAAVRAGTPDHFEGAMAAVLTLTDLKLETANRFMPEGAEVALTDSHGQVFAATNPRAFASVASRWRTEAAKDGSALWNGRDIQNRPRTYSAAPLVDDDVFVILSVPAPALLSWAWLNPISRLLLPVMAFALGLAAVWYAAERGVIRWIVYLQRVAAIYARGRFTVRPLQAERAPPEIRELAATLDAMAGTIVTRDASLMDSLAEKDALMREIHHRVKNNLQIITSLLNMQQRALADPAAKAAMNDTRQRITALAQIYRALYQGPDLKRVDLRPFLEELTAQLLANDMSTSPLVRTEVHADPLVIDPDRLAPIALFAVEAITNAQKHAFGPNGGILSVGFHVRGEEAELSISDDGPGAAETLGGGVGRTLMTAFARQLRGKVSFETQEPRGLTVRLIFPTPLAVDPGT
ncbi:MULTISPECIES: sensor histidine kinase [unclassified Caulobacter]|uniref:sensor histidine kinase PhyK n=1 Tax=unclassified Caulobacter TaxID=2648921 RepID=UPI0006F2A878|nr:MULTISPECIES: histidine kinase dimerization/phosphoacceptor domain -containing protein [unclassified Caulobacter]KQV61977.1 histidine kinase [Caulobacter sp. Root342]KQV64812.1 histidine kinase [Caulobacter sp. Root343]